MFERINEVNPHHPPHEARFPNANTIQIMSPNHSAADLLVERKRERTSVHTYCEYPGTRWTEQVTQSTIFLVGCYHKPNELRTKRGFNALRLAHEAL